MTPLASVATAALLATLAAWQLGRVLLCAADGQRESRLMAISGAVAFGLAVTLGLLAVPGADGGTHKTAWLVLAGALVLLSGLWRDLDRGVRGQSMAALGLAAILAVTGGGVSVTTVKLPFGGLIELGSAGQVLTVAWIVAAAVVVRLLDPLPGLTAGFGLLSAGTFLVVALVKGTDPMAHVDPLSPSLAAVLLGACLGVLLAGGRAGLSLGRAGSGDRKSVV